MGDALPSLAARATDFHDAIVKRFAIGLLVAVVTTALLGAGPAAAACPIVGVDEETGERIVEAMQSRSGAQDVIDAVADARRLEKIVIVLLAVAGVDVVGGLIAIVWVWRRSRTAAL